MRGNGDIGAMLCMIIFLSLAIAMLEIYYNFVGVGN